MKRVLIFFNYHTNQYCGGIANIIASYLNKKNDFYCCGYELDSLNPKLSFSNNKIVSTLQKLVFFEKEKKAIINHFKKEGIPDCFHIHSSRGWILYNDLNIVRFVKKKYHIKTILTIHHAVFENILSKNLFFYKREVNIILKHVDKTILLSKSICDDFIKIGVPKSKLTLLYTFFDNELQRQPRISENKVLKLLFVGLLDKSKGVVDLLKAMSIVNNPNIYLSLCGEYSNGNIKTFIEDYLRKNNNVRFLGYVKGKEKERVFKEADVLVLPSYAEGMPLVIMEALSYGCCIVSTQVGAIPEIIKNDVNGFLLKPGDIGSLVSILMELYGNRDILTNIQNNNYKKSYKYS